MAERQSSSNEMHSAANNVTETAKGINSAGKAVAKAASGNYAGAAKEFVKNPTGIIKAVVAVLVAILIPISLILSILTNGIYDYFFNKNIYSSVSNFVQMQSDFRKNSLSKSYSYFKAEIYSDIVEQMKKQKIDNEQLQDGISEIFADKEALEQIINEACINLSNPTRVGKKYEDYANIENGDKRYFALLEGQNSGNEIVYDRESTAGQTIWNRQLQVIDFNNANGEKIGDTSKAMYTIKYKNSKFYDASESVSMYKALFDSFFDATLTYANTKRLQQTSLLITDKDDSEYSESLAYLQGLINDFRKNKDYKDYNYSDDVDKNGYATNPAGINLDFMMSTAKNLIDIYSGKGTKYEDYYVNYPCQEYRDKMILTMGNLDELLKEFGAGSEATFKDKIDSTPSTLPNDNTFKNVSEKVGEAESFNADDISIDYDEDEAEKFVALENEKMEHFTEFYSNPIFYKNLFTYHVKVSNNDKKGSNYKINKRTQITQTSEDDENSEDVIDNVTVSNIDVHRIVEISVDTCSEQTLFQVYAQYFYDKFLSEDVDVEEWGELVGGIRDNDSDAITQTDYLESIMLYFGGEDVDNTADDYKPIANLNLPNLEDGKNIKDTSFDDSSIVADNGDNKNNLVIPSYTFTTEDSDNNDKTIKTSDAYFSNYLKFITKNSKKDFYAKGSEISQTLNLPTSFSEDITNIISENENASKAWTEGKTKVISAMVVIDSFELNRNINDVNCSFFATNGSENADSIQVSGSLNVTFDNGENINIKSELINPEKNTGKAMLIFSYDSIKKIKSINTLSVCISPENENSAIRNLTYYVGSISDSYVNLMTLGEIYKMYLDAGIVNSSVLTEAGYVVANIYIQYRTDLFNVLFKSLEIESTKRQFITDVSNIVKNDEGNLLIQGRGSDNKALEMTRQVTYGTYLQDKYFYFVSCHPDSLLYMPEGMELCCWDGKRPSSDTLRLDDVTDNRGTKVTFANTDENDLKSSNRISDFISTDTSENYQYLSNYSEILKALDYQGTTECSNWISFKDNLLQYTIICFQSSALDKEGNYQILKRSNYQNSTYGAWRKCEYWEAKSPDGVTNSAYEYFIEETKNPPAGISEDEKKDYIATVATEPLILGTTTQTNILNEYSAIGKTYDYTDTSTYPTFAIAVDLVGATENIYGNMNNYSTLGSNNYSLYDVFDLDEVNNSAYIDESSGYCWPLEDSYDATSIISSSFKGTVTNINNNYKDETTGENTSTMTILVTEKDEETSSEVIVGSEITLRNVKPLLPENSSFDSGQILAYNLGSYSYIDLISSGNISNTFAYFKLSTAIAINPDQTKEDANGNISNVLAMFNGKIIENSSGHLLLYNEEDESSKGGLYCEYEGDTFASCEYPVGTYVSKGSIIGFAGVDFDSTGVNENGTQTSEELEIAESSFKVTIYSDSNYQGSPLIKESSIINNQEDMEIIEMSDSKIVCESTEKVITYSSGGEKTKYPKAKYTFENIKMLKNGDNLVYKVGDTILSGSVVSLVPDNEFPKLTVEYRPEANIIYYKSLLDFFPGREEFANKTKKIIVTVKDTGVDGDSVIDEVVSDSFPVYVGKTTTLIAKASPITFNVEKIKWEEVVSDGSSSLIDITTSNNGHTIKITPKGENYGRTKIKGTFVDENGKLSGGQECTLEVAIIKSPSKIDITYKDYYTKTDGSEGIRNAGLRNTGNFVTNSDNTPIYLINPDKLKSNFKKDKEGKYVVDMFNAVLSDGFGDTTQYNGGEAVRWTLKSNGNANGLSLQDAKNSTNPYTGENEVMNYTGTLLYDGNSVMYNENQYYTLTATLFEQNIADDDLMSIEDKLLNYTVSINIHIINPITKISAKTSAFESVSGKNSNNKLYITPATQKTGINLNKFISWSLKRGSTNIFGPNLKNSEEMVKVDCGKYLQYKNGKITVKDEYLYNSDNPNANKVWGSSTTVTVTLSGKALAYSSLGKAGLSNATFQFNIILDFNVEKILITNFKNANKKQTNVGIYKTIGDKYKNDYTNGGMFVSYYTAFAVEGKTINLNIKAEDPDGSKITGLSPSRFDTNALEIDSLNIKINETGAAISLTEDNDITEILEEELSFAYGEKAKMIVKIVFIPVAKMGHYLDSSMQGGNTSFEDTHSVLSPDGTTTVSGTFLVGDKDDYEYKFYPCSFSVCCYAKHSKLAGKSTYTSFPYNFFKNFELASVENATLTSSISSSSSTISTSFYSVSGENYIQAQVDKKYFKKYFQKIITTPLTNTVNLIFKNVDGYEDYKFYYSTKVTFSYTPKYPDNFTFDNPPV